MASLHEPPPSQSLAIRADCQGLNVDLASGERHESSSCRSPEARNQVSRTPVARDDECHAREPAHSAQTFNLARIVVLNNSHRYFYLWLTKNLWADVSKNSRYTGTTMSRKALRCTLLLSTCDCAWHCVCTSMPSSISLPCRCLLVVHALAQQNHAPPSCPNPNHPTMHVDWP